MKLMDLIVDDRERGVFKVHRSSMTSPEIFCLEQQQIFDRCWLYVGHETEVEERGDYRCRTIAGRPLILIRGSDDQVRVFLNACTHRGASICRSDAGNSRVLQCFYHAWTFDIAGNLVAVPADDAYSPAFDRAALGLKSPSRVDNYRGFYFVSFNPLVEDLVSYLAGATEYIDLVLDQAEEGMRVLPGSDKFDIKANWKIVVENSFDTYHVNPMHRSYLQCAASFGNDDSGQRIEDRMPGTAKALANGHSVVEFAARGGRPAGRWHPIFGEELRDQLASRRQRLVEKHGESRAHRIADNYRLLVVYPNLVINDIMATSIKYYEPLAVDRVKSRHWHLVPKDEPRDVRSIRHDAFLMFYGPGGFSTPDDVEALESCQAGFRATETEWSDISRGMLRAIPLGSDEVQLRGYWRQWHANVQDMSKANVQDGTSKVVEVSKSLRIAG
ncbi:MAG: aromatic ring-hydroxylating dioxygenase subunit alpha [bacterium]|nr:aromatic ring-hydroxylating dioxygenase subunit alpha [bacterium]